MKAIPCTAIVNSKRGYVFTPEEFTSIRQAVKSVREYPGGFAYRLYDNQGMLVGNGFCNQ